MHWYPTPHTWMHRNHHPSSKCTDILPLTHECTANRHSSGKCTGILPLTHECTEIIFPQVNAPESYPSQMNAPKIVTPQVNAQISYLSISYLSSFTPHTWMHRYHHSSGKCTNIPPLTHEYTIIINPRVNASESYPSNINASKRETPQVNAPTSYPSHMNAPKSSSLK